VGAHTHLATRHRAWVDKPCLPDLPWFNGWNHHLLTQDHTRDLALRIPLHGRAAAESPIDRGTLAPPFVAFESTLAAAEAEEEALLMSLEGSNAKVANLDDDLDALVDRVVGVTGNRRAASLYRELFGNKRVFEFKRPQVLAPSRWVKVLEVSEPSAPAMSNAVTGARGP